MFLRLITTEACVSFLYFIMMQVCDTYKAIFFSESRTRMEINESKSSWKLLESAGSIPTHQSASISLTQAMADTVVYHISGSRK